MFETTVGPVEEAGSKAFLRPETAQGIFINFKNVLQLARRQPPFGIAQIGKSFRNEITPGNFLFRVREFEQMEMEFFVPPAEAEQWYRYWIDARYDWYLRYGLRRAHLRVREHGAGGALALLPAGRATSSTTIPIGWSELEGVANRGDFDLTRAHGVLRARSSSSSARRATSATCPYVIEPAVRDRADLRRDARRRLRRGGGRRPRADGAPAAPARSRR